MRTKTMMMWLYWYLLPTFPWRWCSVVMFDLCHSVLVRCWIWVAQIPLYLLYTLVCLLYTFVLFLLLFTPSFLSLCSFFSFSSLSFSAFSFFSFSAVASAVARSVWMKFENPLNNVSKLCCLLFASSIWAICLLVTSSNLSCPCFFRMHIIVVYWSSLCTLVSICQDRTSVF